MADFEERPKSCRTFCETVVTAAVRYAARYSLNLHLTSETLPPAPDGASRLLYIHVPFCHILCPYCSFHKFPFEETTARRYFRVLRDEMRQVRALGYRFDALYIGGGTTTVLPDELATTVALARELFGISEVSCESDATHLDALEAGSVDRLSVGIQSFDDERLKQIGRYHRFGSAQSQYERVEEAIGRFGIVNVDMIYNYPGQEEAELLYDLETLLRLRPQQVTFYPLMYAPGVAERLKSRWGTLDTEKEAALYRLIAERMEETYTQRSSWAWSLKGEGIIDEYVIERSEYVGIGSGAFSFIGDTLYANTFSLPEYVRLVEGSGRPAVSHRVSFGRRAIAQYRMMVELFGMGTCTKERLWPESLFLRVCGACRNGRPTRWGGYLFSAMMREFYNGMDRVRETMRRPLTTADGRIETDASGQSEIRRQEKAHPVAEN